MPVALHRICFELGPGTRLDLEWTKGRGGEASPVPVPGATLTETELEPDDADAFVPAICWRADAPVLFEPFQLRENTDYYIDVTLPVSLIQAAERIASEPGWPFGPRLTGVFRPEPPRRWKHNTDGTLTISGQLRLRNHAGILNLGIGEAAPFAAEVVCSKLRYMEEFKALLDEVASELTDLLLHYDSPVGASFNLSDLSPETQAALLFQLRTIMAGPNLPTALEEIRRAFHSRLEERRTFQDAFEVEDFDFPAFLEEMDAASLVPGGPLRRIFRGYTPRAVPAIQTIDTPDTPENRYVRFFLEELRQLAERLAASYARKQRNHPLREIEGWITVLDEELAGGVWKSVGPFSAFPSNSQVLQKRRGYREILRFDLSLHMSLELPWKRSEQLAEGLIGDLRPVNELYEYWCFFLLRRSLSELCLAETPRGRSFIDTNGGFQVHLRRGSRSRVGFIYRREEGRVLTVNLFYNRRFTRPPRPLDFWHGSYTATFHPDYSLEAVLVAGGQTTRHWLHFDAKYRIDRADIRHLLALDAAPVSDDDPQPGDYEAELARLHRQDDLFAVQDEVARTIAALLAAHVQKAEVERALLKPPAIWRAYDCYMRAVGIFASFWSSFEVERLYEARRLLEHCLSLDPVYARAHVTLSHTYTVAWTQRMDGDYLMPATLARAYELARRAVQLDPNLPQAHAQLGIVLTWKRQPDASLAEFEKAMSLNASFSDWRLIGALIFAGEPARAIDAGKAHMRLDPLYLPLVPGWLGFAYYMLRRYPEALLHLQECVLRSPNYRTAHQWLAATYARLGQLQEAQAEAAEVLRIDPKYTIDGHARTTNVFRLPEDAAHYFDGLRKAGLPEN